MPPGRSPETPIMVSVGHTANVGLIAVQSVNLDKRLLQLRAKRKVLTLFAALICSQSKHCSLRRHCHIPRQTEDQLA